MKILALEFSSNRRSVAVAEALPGQPVHLLGQAAESGPHSLKALVLIDSALKQANLPPGQIDCLAVGLGPGSYTGIRAAISVAQGWQVARNVRLVGLSTVEALAAQAHRDSLQGVISFVIDAQRNEFYLAVYEMLPAGPRLVQALRLATRAEVKARLDAGDLLAGPELTRWFPTARTIFPDAAIVGELASRSSEFISGDKLLPIYLRETSFVKAPPPRTNI